MRFDLTDLRVFLCVVEAGSLTAGAQRAHMTLASASQRVRAMEDLLGHPLLQRHAQGVRPTEAGRTLLHHARTVLAQMERLRGELGAYGAGLQGHVRLLCNTSAMTEHLPEPLGRFLATHPQVSVALEERASDAIVDALRAGLCDIGIVSDAVDTEGLARMAFRRDDLMLVMPAGHALARRRRVRLAELTQQAVVGLAEDSPFERHIALHARRQGQRLAYRVRVGSFEAVCGMVEQGIGVGIVPQTAARRCARTMQLRRASLDEPWAARTLLACMPQQAADLSLHAQGLLQALIAAPAG
ncbi:LysR family transcriptional regulator [Variovorax ginsengisoli]|uniref:DNA-binding transcriptional LysR family regulator n=1 Tax=Variovorax ginsengisoli TaxID=363844 RepID=A0ABT9SAY3_9BURK|nr:LysR family transcriptional regulator [Variovorax ginsengisoli]MDP9901513.1 DNA-binding transcriptional LysR family regulator [Variovorax ginsengisoli]